MTAVTFFCEHPAHIGDRRVPAKDRRVLTVDITDEKTSERFRRITPVVNGVPQPRREGGLRLCRSCADHATAVLDAGVAYLDLAVDHVLPHQEALV